MVLAGEAKNIAAATQLADECACFTNTPGGGALVVGVENRTGELIGTSLDPEWLRHAIYTRVDIAPAVEERFVHAASHRGACDAFPPPRYARRFSTVSSTETGRRPNRSP